MRAESTIFRAAQKPMTVFGVSPLHLILILGSGFVLLIVFIAIDLAQVGVVLAFGGVGVTWYRTFRKTQADHHYPSTHFVSTRFWRAQKQRTLLAGRRPIQRQGGKA
jgi:type IV secretory pathway VirB3-like protein